jgi:hypothetical protein
MKTDKETEQEVQEIFDGMTREESKQSLIDAGFEVEDSEPGYEGLILFDEQTNIRQWFGVIDEYEDNEVNEKLDEYLNKVMISLFKFEPLIKQNNIVTTIEKWNQINLDEKDIRYFLRREMCNIHFPQLIKLCRYELQNTHNAIAEVNYYVYALNEQIPYFNNRDELEENIYDYISTIDNGFHVISNRYIK